MKIYKCGWCQQHCDEDGNRIESTLHTSVEHLYTACKVCRDKVNYKVTKEIIK